MYCRIESVALCGAMFLLTASGCNQAPPAVAQPAAPGVPAPAGVPKIVQPQRQPIRRVVAQPGQIEAFQQTPIYTKIAGFVQEVKQDIGDFVERGKTLAVLSVPEMDEELKQKDAQVKQAQVEVEQAQKFLEVANAHLPSTAALVERWSSEFQRLQKLTTIDKGSVEETRFQWKAAQANHEEAKARAAKAEADIRVAQAKVKVAEADRARMAALVDYAQVRAPYDGFITKRNIDQGHFILPASASGTKSEPLFVIVQGDPARVFVDVPEADAVWVGEETKARIRVPVLQGKEFTGKVTRSSWSFDNRSRTLRTEIDIENKSGELRPGMYAYAQIELEHKNAWTVSASAIVTQNEQVFCWRMVNGHPVRTPVQPGLRDAQRVEVLQWQLKPGHWSEPTGKEEVVESGASVPVDTK